MEGILCFLSGLMIGAAVGYTVAAVMHMAARADKEIEMAKCEPVIHAHWELEVRFPSGIEWRKCSRCGRQVNTQDDMDCVEQFPYCHCGAKMDEGVFDDTETICEADDGHGGTAQ